MAINIGEFLTKRAILSPRREGLVCNELRMTFEQMNSRANQLAAAMQRLGIGKGDRVALLALNEPEYYDMLFGLGKIGAVLVPVNYRLAAPEVSYILSDCGAKVLVFSKEYVEIVNTVRQGAKDVKLVGIMDDPPEWASSYKKLLDAEPTGEPKIQGGGNDTLAILYTSGTTGRPKGAMLTHDNFYCTSVSLHVTLGYTGETFLIPLPLFHIGALGGVPMFIHLGQKSVLLRSFDPKRMLELIQEEKITGFGTVPAMLMFLKLVPGFEKYSFKTVKVILVYAAPVPVTLIKEYAASGIEIQQLYGLTECTGPASLIDPEHAIAKAGSCGLPIFHSEIRLVDDQGKDVGPEVLGELLIRSENVMKGYWNRPDETSRAIIDGWLCTGDLAKKDKDGFLYILDRKKDMIISGGENIYPAEIEDMLLQNPKVADAAVIGYPDPKWGEAVKAIVVLKPGQQLSEEELISWCQGKIGKYKIPKKVIFVANIPRTPTGKILKRELRTQYN